MIYKLSLLLIFILILGLSVGCSDREEPETNIGSTAKADEALKQAKTYLNSAGVETSFGDPSMLTRPEDFIPQPNELASKDKQENLQKAIEQLNIVLSEIEQGASLAPSLAPIGSLSDRGIVHFYLGLAYILEAISRLLISDDPDTTFILTYDPNANMGEWFTYGISSKTKAKLDAIKNPMEYPTAFTEKERQAIIDAVDLISNALVKPASASILPQTSSVEGSPYIHSAIWHFEQAVLLLSEYSPDLKKALQDFNKEIERFEEILQENAIMWGFTYTARPRG